MHMKKILAFSLTLALFSFANLAVFPVHGAVNEVAGNTYYLYGSGVTAANTSVTLTSFKQPVNQYPLTMANFGDAGYITFEPGNALRQEFVSFTGVTQNADGTATLTGLSRGLAPVSPYTASSTIAKAHGGGTAVSISNSPQFYQRFPKKDSNETITGTWTFSTFPITPAVAAGSETAIGVVELATAAEAAASTLSGSVGRLALSTAFASSTWNSATAGNVIPVTGLASKTIDNMFIATSSLYGPAASSSVLTQDASGGTAWGMPNMRLLHATTTTAALTYATTTLATTAQHLVYVVYIPGTNNDETPAFVFNGDGGTNYGYRTILNGTVGQPIGNAGFIAFSTTATTSPQFYRADIWNEASRVKTVTMTGMKTGPGASPPTVESVSGAWNNTSAQISTIVLWARNGQTFNAGTRILIYGSAM